MSALDLVKDQLATITGRAIDVLEEADGNEEIAWHIVKILKAVRSVEHELSAQPAEKGAAA